MFYVVDIHDTEKLVSEATSKFPIYRRCSASRPSSAPSLGSARALSG